MHRFRPLIAFVLAALWLPAVVHCGVETLSEVADESRCCSHESDTSAASAGTCVADHCEVFDEGHFKGDSDGSLVTQPPSLFCLGLVVETILASGPGKVACTPPGGESPPAGLSRRWMFELRAAPLANAPGLFAG